MSLLVTIYMVLNNTDKGGDDPLDPHGRQHGETENQRPKTKN